MTGVQTCALPIFFRIDDSAVDVRENFKFVGTAYVISIRGSAIGNDAMAMLLTHLARLKGFDHAVGLRHTAYPLIRFYGHVSKTRAGYFRPNFTRSLTVRQECFFEQFFEGVFRSAHTPVIYFGDCG